MNVSRRTVLAAMGGAVLCGAQPTTRRELTAEASAPFGEPARQALIAAISDRTFRGKIDAATVAELMRLEGKSMDALMLDLLPLARTFASPPLSAFYVGAVVQGGSGSLYLGANIEVPGHALGLTVHAEQASLANAYMSGESSVAAIAVTAAPCGHCRQFLNEVSLEGDIRVLVAGAAPTKLSALLPMAFGPKDLGFQQGALPVRETTLPISARFRDPLASAALEAASKSYSPYTSSHSGIAILTADQRTFTGSYIENAAFNPSLSPLQTALAGLLAAGVRASTITRAALVEIDGAKISQASVTRAALSALARTSRFEAIKLRRPA